MATEKRLIDANALKTIFDKQYDDAFMQERTRTNSAWWGGYATGVNWGRNTITDIPAVDAVEVVHGQWDKYTDEKFNGYDSEGRIRYRKVRTYYCNKCGHGSAVRSNYCPNCGAKMDGDGNGT